MLFDRHIRRVSLGNNMLDRGINTTFDEIRLVAVRFSRRFLGDWPLVLLGIGCCDAAICGFEFFDWNFFIILLISRIDLSNSNQKSLSVLYLLWRCLSVRGH